MIKYYERIMRLLMEERTAPTPSARWCMVRALEKLSKNHELLLESTESIKTVEEKESWAKVFRDQAKIYARTSSVANKFLNRIAEVIECELGLIEMFGVNYKTSSEYLEVIQGIEYCEKSSEKKDPA